MTRCGEEAGSRFLAAERTYGADSAHGDHAVMFWDGVPFTASVRQTVTGVPAGVYTLQATTQGTKIAATDTRTLGATTSAGAWSAPLEFSEWRVFHTTTLSEIVVGEDGVVEISADLALSAGAWGVFDDVRLVAAGAGATLPVDFSKLDRLIAAAAEAPRDGADAEELAALDDAVAISEVVRAGSEATQQDANGAAKLLRTALKEMRR